jgi:hypothetical protein
MDEEVKPEEAAKNQTGPAALPSDISNQEVVEQDENVYQLRIRRINELRTRSQRFQNPLAAAVQAAIADLLELQLTVSEAIRKACGSEPIGLEKLDELVPAIDIKTRLAKPTAQYIQIGVQMAKAANRSKRTSEEIRNVLPTAVPNPNGGWMPPT